MVGIPGRSKGCRTCRKRKKGCDLKRPACGQCEGRGLECGGYDEDRIFVSQNTNFAPARKDVARQPSLDSTAAGYSSEVWNGQLVRHTAARKDRIEVVLPDSMARSAYGEKSVEMFLDMFLPKSAAGTVRVSGLANIIPHLYIQDEALRLALLALSSAVTGMSNGDVWMVEQGKKLYGMALKEMAKAVRDPKRAHTEAMLAVPRVLGLFEILFGADFREQVQANSWQSHADGELALIKARGPRAHADGVAHQLFIDARLSPIISSIRSRKKTLINSKEWKTLPFSTQPKRPKDSLLDILAGVPEILEDLDILAHREDARSKDYDNVIAKCWELDAQLEQWLILNNTHVFIPEQDTPTPIMFPDPSIGHLSVLYWTTCTILYQALIDTCDPSKLLSNSSKHPRPYARKIARSVPYFFDPSLGIWGATNVSFPTGIALIFLRRSEEDAAYRALIFRAWGNPKLPTAIRNFLKSMQRESQRRLVDRTKLGEARKRSDACGS